MSNMDEHREVSRLMATVEKWAASPTSASPISRLLSNDKFSTVNVNMGLDGVFENIQEMQKTRESKPFLAMLRIKRRADSILKQRQVNDIELVADAVLAVIEFYKEEQIESAIDDHARSLFVAGGWELKYLPHYYGDEPVREEDIRELLENWPPDAIDSPCLLCADDIDDFEALQEIVSSGYEISGINLPSFNQWEMYAILALIKLDDAAWTLNKRDKEPCQGVLAFACAPHPDIEKMIQVGNLLIEATEIICYAEREFSDSQLREVRAKQMASDEDRIAAKARAEVSRNALDTRYATTNEAKAYVRKEWAAKKDDYGGNKTAFCRTYVRMVSNEFKTAKGDPLVITEKQMNQVWLSDTPVTRKRGPVTSKPAR